MEYINIGNIDASSISGTKKGYYNKLKVLHGFKDDNNLWTRLHCQIGSNKLLVVAGESWSFGDSLHPYVKANKSLDNIPYRLMHTFAAKLANYLGWDLLLVAKPGHCNLGVLDRLTTGLNEVEQIKKYDEIHLFAQFTSPGRDMHAQTVDNSNAFDSITSGVHEFKDWHVKYEEILIQEFLNLVEQKNITQVIFWKNFYRFVADTNKFSNNKVKFVPYTWSELLFELGGFDNHSAEIMELQVDFEHFHYIKNDIDFLIHNSNDWDKYNNNLTQSWLNGYHPTEAGHWLWMNELRNYL